MLVKVFQHHTFFNDIRTAENWLIYTEIADIYEFSLGFFLETSVISQIFDNFVIFPKFLK